MGNTIRKAEYDTAHNSKPFDKLKLLKELDADKKATIQEWIDEAQIAKKKSMNETDKFAKNRKQNTRNDLIIFLGDLTRIPASRQTHTCTHEPRSEYIRRCSPCFLLLTSYFLVLGTDHWSHFFERRHVGT